MPPTTSHFVMAQLDEGPVVVQDVTRVTHKGAVKDLVSKGRNLAREVLSQAVEKHLEHRVLIYRNKTVVFDCIR